MNAVTTTEQQAIVMEAPRAPLPVAMPDRLLEIAVERGASLEQLDRLIELKAKWFEQQRIERADAAKREFAKAFAKFKSSAIKVLRTADVTDGPLKGRKHATMDAVNDAVTERLSEVGLSIAHRIVEDARDWIRVACVLTHVDGHSEDVVMGGPPDTSGGKNSIQARASTLRYLQRYTAEAVLGIAEADPLDNDGAGGADQAAAAPAADAELAALIAGVKRLNDDEDALSYWLSNRAKTGKAGERRYEAFKEAVADHRKTLKGSRK